MQRQSDVRPRIRVGPRRASPIGRAEDAGEVGEYIDGSEAKFENENGQLILHAPPQPDAIATVFELQLDGTVDVEKMPIVLKPDSDGRIRLRAIDATINGGESPAGGRSHRLLEQRGRNRVVGIQSVGGGRV